MSVAIDMFASMCFTRVFRSVDGVGDFEEERGCRDR